MSGSSLFAWSDIEEKNMKVTVPVGSKHTERPSAVIETEERHQWRIGQDESPDPDPGSELPDSVDRKKAIQSKSKKMNFLKIPRRDKGLAVLSADTLVVTSTLYDHLQKAVEDGKLKNVKLRIDRKICKIQFTAKKMDVQKQRIKIEKALHVQEKRLLILSRPTFTRVSNTRGLILFPPTIPSGGAATTSGSAGLWFSLMGPFLRNDPGIEVCRVLNSKKRLESLQILATDTKKNALDQFFQTHAYIIHSPPPSPCPTPTLSYASRDRTVVSPVPLPPPPPSQPALTMMNHAPLAGWERYNSKRDWNQARPILILVNPTRAYWNSESPWRKEVDTTPDPVLTEIQTRICEAIHMAQQHKIPILVLKESVAQHDGEVLYLNASVMDLFVHRAKMLYPEQQQWYDPIGSCLEEYKRTDGCRLWVCKTTGVVSGIPREVAQLLVCLDVNTIFLAGGPGFTAVLRILIALVADSRHVIVLHDAIHCPIIRVAGSSASAAHSASLEIVQVFLQNASSLLTCQMAEQLVSTGKVQISKPVASPPFASHSTSSLSHSSSSSSSSSSVSSFSASSSSVSSSFSSSSSSSFSSPSSSSSLSSSSSPASSSSSSSSFSSSSSSLVSSEFGVNIENKSDHVPIVLVSFEPVSSPTGSANSVSQLPSSSAAPATSEAEAML